MNTPRFQRHQHLSGKHHGASQTPRSSASAHPQLLSLLCFSSSSLFKTHSQTLPLHAPPPHLLCLIPPPSIYFHNTPPPPLSLFLPLSLAVSAVNGNGTNSVGGALQKRCLSRLRIHPRIQMQASALLLHSGTRMWSCCISMCRFAMLMSPGDSQRCQASSYPKSMSKRPPFSMHNRAGLACGDYIGYIYRP